MQTLVQPTANITPFTPHYKIKRTKSSHDLWKISFVHFLDTTDHRHKTKTPTQ